MHTARWLAVWSIVVTGLVTGLAAACHPRTPPSPPAQLEPGEVPPLPPSSGTPIGALVDASVELRLRDDQLAALRDLDQSLAARNDRLDAQQRTPRAAAGGAPSSGRRGRMGGRGMGRGMSAGAGGGPTSGGPGGAGSPGPTSGAPPIAQVSEDRSANTRDALARAFAILDPDQRIAARKLLVQRGFEADLAPDRTRPAATPAGAAEPSDPDAAELPPDEP